MITILFNSDIFNTFFETITPSLPKWFDKQISLLKGYEKDFFKFVKDDIGITKILTAIPNDFDGYDTETMDELHLKINDKKEEVQTGIDKPINKSNLKKYLKLLNKSELKMIAQNHSIRGESKYYIRNIQNHTFSEHDKIGFHKDFFEKRIEEIFSTIFVKFYKYKWTTDDKYKFVTCFGERLSLNSCPYCNRNYIFVVNEETGKLRPELDHFYPKSEYPYFAMSFFNLIPSCPTCNHTKGTKFNENLVNPYSTMNDDNKVEFTINVQDIDFVKVKEEKDNFDSFGIMIKDSENENIKIFQLEKLYDQHKDTVVDLLVKHRYYPDSYISFLRTFNFSEDQIYRYLFSNYSQDKDLHKRPLSKLTRDIAIELGFIKQERK